MANTVSPAFAYRNHELHVERVPLRALAERYGTPLYVYSRGHFTEQYRALAGALRRVRPLICFSVKTNSNAAVIHTFARLGAGADVVSAGELFRALRAGIPAARIVFAGVGKTAAEIEYALRKGILFFTVESEPELERIAECAGRIRKTARVALRVNPDVDPKTHRFISTGKKENKFGLDLERAEKAAVRATRLANVELVGLHMHIGSQILLQNPFVRALERLIPLFRALKKRHPSVRFLDIGGGLGIAYRADQTPLSAEVFAKAVLPLLQEAGAQVVLEPGRFLVGNGGALLTTVQYVKRGAAKQFVIVDAGMNDLIRPPLYEAHHEVLAVRAEQTAMEADVVGPICESGDYLALDRKIPQVKSGDVLAVLSAGAYGFSMSSNYNSRCRAAEVMVAGDRHALIRRRETWHDLVRHETPLPLKWARSRIEQD
jgi:diaminopimelate decarboxylase